MTAREARDARYYAPFDAQRATSIKNRGGAAFFMLYNA